MFLDFFFLLKDKKVPVTITEYLTFIKALPLADCSLDNLYYLARALLVKSEGYFDIFDQCFAYYFKDIDVKFTLNDDILEWLMNPENMKYLTEKEIEMLKSLDLEELRRLFEERLKEQNERHDGGNKWIGTGGTSPFGDWGYHPSGISFGSQHRMGKAMKLAMARTYQNYRHDLTLDIRQIQVALKKLRRLKRIGCPDELDLEDTIDQTCKNAGDLELIFRPERKNNVRVLLLMDAGGSMDPYANLCNQLFSAAYNVKFFKDFKYFYFHNCIYQYLYKDMYQSDKSKIATQDVIRKYDKNYKLIILGDAMMATSELFESGGSLYYNDPDGIPGIVWLKRLRDHFGKAVWLNPTKYGGFTKQQIEKLYPMFYLSIDGLEEAVKKLV
ncbi:MAG: VWA domain-containing protein [Candidatus Lokiarchaeota archaeon]|nr:VWA domain-containing protein [Candidatus Lokiarchaeota archaeon]